MPDRTVHHDSVSRERRDFRRRDSRLRRHLPRASNHQQAAYAARCISELEGFSLPFSAPRFNEFVVRARIEAPELLSRLASEKNITGGLALSRYYKDRPNDFLVCVTETNSRQEIDALVAGLENIATSIRF